MPGGPAQVLSLIPLRPSPLIPLSVQSLFLCLQPLVPHPSFSPSFLSPSPCFPHSPSVPSSSPHPLPHLFPLPLSTALLPPLSIVSFSLSNLLLLHLRSPCLTCFSFLSSHYSLVKGPRFIVPSANQDWTGKIRQHLIPADVASYSVSETGGICYCRPSVALVPGELVKGSCAYGGRFCAPPPAATRRQRAAAGGGDSATISAGRACVAGLPPAEQPQGSS